MSAAPLARSRPPARDDAGFTAVQRRALRLAEHYIDARGGKVFGSGVARYVRNKVRIGKGEMSALLFHLLEARGYYDEISQRAGEPER